MENKLPKEERLRVAIDSWIGTLTRVIGFLLLLYAIFIDHFHTQALLPAATGLIFLKDAAAAMRKRD